MDTFKSIFKGSILSLKNQLYMVIIGVFFMFVKLVAPKVILNMMIIVKNTNISVGFSNYFSKEFRHITELSVSISSLALYFTISLFALMYITEIVTKKRIRFNGYLNILEIVYVKIGVTFTCIYIYAFQISYIINKPLILQLYNPDKDLLDIGFYFNLLMVILLLLGMLMHGNSANKNENMDK